MDIQQQVEELLKKKGVAPPHMNQGQFFEELSRRLEQELPETLQATVQRISREIAYDEMARVGRSVACRYAGDRSEKRCNKPSDCLTCPNYKPIPRWRRWLTAPKNLKYLEILVIAAATITFILALLFPPIGVGILCIWFVIVVISRAQTYVTYKLLQLMKEQRGRGRGEA